MLDKSDKFLKEDGDENGENKLPEYPPPFEVTVDDEIRNKFTMPDSVRFMDNLWQKSKKELGQGSDDGEDESDTENKVNTPEF